MNQSITIGISGTFPNYEICFSAVPAPVKQGKTETITYSMAHRGFRIIGVNIQRDPFDTSDELVWAIPSDQQSIILTDINSDPRASTFGFQIVFNDAAGNQFSSIDPQIQNEGVELHT